MPKSWVTSLVALTVRGLPETLPSCEVGLGEAGAPGTAVLRGLEIALSTLASAIMNDLGGSRICMPAAQLGGREGWGPLGAGAGVGEMWPLHLALCRLRTLTVDFDLTPLAHRETPPSLLLRGVAVSLNTAMVGGTRRAIELVGLRGGSSRESPSRGDAAAIVAPRAADGCSQRRGLRHEDQRQPREGVAPQGRNVCTPLARGGERRGGPSGAFKSVGMGYELWGHWELGSPSPPCPSQLRFAARTAVQLPRWRAERRHSQAAPAPARS